MWDRPCSRASRSRGCSTCPTEPPPQQPPSPRSSSWRRRRQAAPTGDGRGNRAAGRGSSGWPGSSTGAAHRRGYHRWRWRPCSGPGPSRRPRRRGARGGRARGSRNWRGAAGPAPGPGSGDDVTAVASGFRDKHCQTCTRRARRGQGHRAPAALPVVESGLGARRLARAAPALAPPPAIGFALERRRAERRKPRACAPSATGVAPARPASVRRRGEQRRGQRRGRRRRGRRR